jgi:hypothetical protein
MMDRKPGRVKVRLDTMLCKVNQTDPE